MRHNWTSWQGVSEMRWLLLRRSMQPPWQH
jgi:hypothetical protein